MQLYMNYLSNQFLEQEGKLFKLLIITSFLIHFVSYTTYYYQELIK